MSIVRDTIDDLRKIDNIESTANSASSVAGSKQDTLVSGTNVKTVGGVSILGDGDIEITAFLPNFVETITSSRTYTVPKTGKYRIIAVGAGGSGGSVFQNGCNIKYATGGGSGGVCIHEVDLALNSTLSVTIGAGVKNSSYNVDGANGGNTIVTNGAFTLTAGGGNGGKYNTGLNNLLLLGGAGGTATGANISNITGGNGGSIINSGGFEVGGCATGGGGAPLVGNATTRGGNITILAMATGLFATGGGSCFFRGGDITTSSSTSSNSSSTGGGGTGSNGIDGGLVTSTLGGNWFNAIINTSIVGGGGSGLSNGASPVSIFGCGSGGNTGNSQPALVAETTTKPLGGGGGSVYAYTFDQTVDRTSKYIYGGGSGGVCSTSVTYFAEAVSGFNGIVFIEYKG